MSVDESRRLEIGIQSARRIREMAEAVLTLEVKSDLGTDAIDVLAIVAMCDDAIDRGLERLAEIDIALFKEVSHFHHVETLIANLTACGHPKSLKRMDEAGTIEQVRALAAIVDGFQR